MGGTEQKEAPRWVEEAYAFYNAHGYYRAIDLQRVLGAPEEHFTVRASDDGCAQILLDMIGTPQ